MSAPIRVTSTNGRWGFEVSIRDGDINAAASYSRAGDVFHGYRAVVAHTRGEMKGMTIVRLKPDSECSVLIVKTSGDVEPVFGCTMVHKAFLQTHNEGAVVNMAVGDAVKVYGYRKRSSAVYVMGEPKAGGVAGLAPVSATEAYDLSERQKEIDAARSHKRWLCVDREELKYVGDPKKCRAFYLEREEPCTPEDAEVWCDRKWGLNKKVVVGPVEVCND